ncbi:hypothetical protein ASF61_02385 [Duganella sp. Leaf126]|uniref:DUF3667 domain-containing protein n=1 Tax=Duganella sp. Leaf126 TaxID=1736266 RepID=UPI0006F3CC6A|nr:DUF3667 domain-containing protein [Duganella sp. Leaf126]KQQ47506.1 hypothetical protein ASF61_02385 [Duganella sp. Leaf126]
MSIAVNPVIDAHAPVRSCPNCEAEVSGHFCAHCGQETHLHHASTREFLHEFIGHYVALEGKLWATLRRLILRPGELTNEYMRGRRVRYVQPLRIYLTFSLIFFLLLKLGGGFDSSTEDQAHQAGEHSAAVAVHPGNQAADKAGHTAADKAGDGADDSESVRAALDGWPTLQAKWQLLSRMSSQEQVQLFKDGIFRYAPCAIFCLMPVFALLLKMLYLGSGRRFGEHMLFALHTNAFAFLTFSLMLLINIQPLRMVLWLWLLAYLPWAMRRVYHRSRFGTVWRWLVLMLCFTLAIALAVLACAMVGLLSVH